MAKVVRLDIERLSRMASDMMIVEQAATFNQGLVLLTLLEREGRVEFLARLRSIFETSPEVSFERALGWPFYLRIAIFQMRLAKAARQIPGVYDLFGKSIITHWFQSLSLKEIDAIDSPIRIFGAPVGYLEKRGIKKFQQHVREWRHSRAKGAD